MPSRRHLDVRSAFDIVGAWASVLGDHEVAAQQPGRDHVVDRVAAGAADPEHCDPGASAF
jgi:hypothetical protein